MWRLWFFGVGLLMVSLGCRSGGLAGSTAFTGSTASNVTPAATLAGVVIANPAGTEFFLANMREITIQGVNLAIPLNAGDWVETNQTVKVDVFQVYQGETYDYHAVISPSDASSPAYWRFTNQPTIQVENASAFIWGHMGRASAAKRSASTMVNAISDGTTIVMEVVSPTIHRVHLISGAKVTVTCGASSRDITTEEHYVTIDSSCVISAPIPIAGDPIVQPIIDKMKEIAIKAGWIPPP